MKALGAGHCGRPDRRARHWRRHACLAVIAGLLSAFLAPVPWSSTARASGDPAIVSSGLSLDLGQVFPPDGGNTVDLTQPLLARIRDTEGQTVIPGSILFQLTDLSSNQTRSISSAAPPYDPVRGFARSSAASLIADHSYRVDLSAQDSAGNSGTWSWTFGAMTMNISSAAASIRESVGKPLGANAPDVWRFTPIVDMGHFTVTTSSSQHSGFGPVGQRVPLRTARVQFILNGTLSSTTVNPYGPSETIAVYKEFTKLRSEGTYTRTLYGQTVALAPIDVALPSGASSPILSMDVTHAIPFTPATSCSDPLNAAVGGCTPDPLRFFIAEDFASQIAAKQAAAPLAQSSTDIFVTEMGFACAPAQGKCTLPHPHWAALQPGGSVDPLHQATLADGVQYSGSLVPVIPDEFVEACNAGFPCVSERAATSVPAALGSVCAPSPCPAGGGGYSNPQVQANCVLLDGFDRASNCTQEWAVYDIGEPTGSGINHIAADWSSQVGVADDMLSDPTDGNQRNPPPLDSLGVSWYDDNHATDGAQKWFFSDDSNQGYFVNEDGYYNRGDIPQCSKVNPGCNGALPPYRTSNISAIYNNSGQNSISTDAYTNGQSGEGWGYGMNIPYSPSAPLDPLYSDPASTVQYEDVCGSLFPVTNPINGGYCADNSGDQGLFSGYYNPDEAHFYYRDGIARAYDYEVDANWSGTDSVQSGTEVIAFGHMFTDYSVDWSLGWGVGPEGPDLSFEFKPQNQQMETTYTLSVRYCFGGATC